MCPEIKLIQAKKRTAFFLFENKNKIPFFNLTQPATVK